MAPTPYRAGIIGCGRMAGGHVHAYREAGGCAVAACADISEQALGEFAERHDIAHRYRDYRDMLARERLDLVSIVTWPPDHAAMTCDAAAAGVRGVLCEKPMATSLAEADRMLEACRRSGTLLVVNHQRRWAAPYRTARDVLARGAIGDLIEMQTFLTGSDLLTDATHVVDLFRYYNGDCPVEWVYAQVTPGDRTRYGRPVENLSLVYMKFANEVRALLGTGRIPRPSFEEGPRLGPLQAYCGARLTGTDGILHVAGDLSKEPPLRMLAATTCGWQELAPDAPSDLPAMAQSVRRMVECVESGSREHLNAGEHGRAALEVLLASFVSARRREPVYLPLEEGGFTYEALLREASA
jgi:predicted dehydrogenase